MQWTHELKTHMEREEDRVIQLYQNYIRLSDADKETLNDQWNEYFRDVGRSPYYALYKKTKTFLSMGPVQRIEAITLLVDEFDELKNTYTKIRKPSVEDPQFLLTAYGQIMHMRRIHNFASEAKEKKERKEGTLVKNVRSAFGLND